MPGAHRRRPGKVSEVARLEEKLDGVAAILTASQSVPTGKSNTSTSYPSDLTPLTCIGEFIQNDNEAEMILHAFRSEMAPLFPFVVVPPSTTFAHLREEKPFLTLAILLVGCRHDSMRQTAIAKAMREIISHSMLIKGERDLDMLQSLLVYVNW